jgi:hypothetical protein
MSVFWRKIKAEWHSSPLFRWGIIGVVLALAFYLWLVLGDVNQDIENDIAALLAQRQRLGSIQNEDFWPERAKQILNVNVQMESSFWNASTKGLAQANLQSWLDRLLRRMGVSNVKMQIENPVEVDVLESVWQVDVLLEGSLEPARFLDLLNEIETNPQVTIVISLDYERQRFMMRLRTFVQSTKVGS